MSKVLHETTKRCVLCKNLIAPGSDVEALISDGSAGLVHAHPCFEEWRTYRDMHHAVETQPQKPTTPPVALRDITAAFINGRLVNVEMREISIDQDGESVRVPLQFVWVVTRFSIHSPTHNISVQLFMNNVMLLNVQTLENYSRNVKLSVPLLVDAVEVRGQGRGTTIRFWCLAYP